MKSITKFLCLAVLALAVKGLAITTVSGPVAPGQWNSDLWACIDYAEANGVPLVAVWGKEGCHNCNQSYTLWFDTAEFKAWMSESGIVFFYIKSATWSSTPKELDWISGSLTAAPFVRVYWKKNGKTMGDKRFSGLPSQLADYGDKLKPSAMINRIMSIIPDWTPGPQYAGGYFSVTNTVDSLCLQAEPTTTALKINLYRTSKEAYQQKLEVTRANARAAAIQYDVTWSSETNQTFTIPDFDKELYAEGATFSLSLLNEKGETMSSTIVKCVPAQANSSSNPYWIGEKESLEWGDWTMDLEAAQAKVAAATEEDACILGYVDGSLWCPWCHKAEENFLESAEFKAFVSDHHAVLVQIDCPQQHVSAPTLLNHEVGKNNDASGPAEVSGTGYLTRKMADLDVAAELFERNYNIVSNLWRRPESTAWRVGMGNFILLDKSGSIKGRLNWAREDTKLTNAQLVAANITRMEELFSLLDEKGEEDNQNWRTTKTSIPVIGAFEGNTLSSSDPVDTFVIPEAAKGSKQKFTVSSDADLIVSIVQVTGGVTESVLATAKGNAKDQPLSVLADIPEAADVACYLVVEGDTTTTFKGTYNEANQEPTLRTYSVTGEVVLVPQEKRNTVTSEVSENPTVTMLLEESVTYRFEGLADNASVLESVSDGFYTVKAGQAGEVKLSLTYDSTLGAGKITYQKWADATVGFFETPKSVTESACAPENKTPLKIKVSRRGGQSGWVKARVVVDADKTTLLAEDADHPRYQFEPVEVEWAEGDLEAKEVELLVYDYPEIYFGEGSIVLKIESVSSELEGSATIAEGKESFTQPVTENDKADPGIGQFVGADPFFSKKLTVYVREGETATLLAKRTKASDGIVSAVLKSSVPGVSFATESAEDLKTVDGAVHLYWGNHKNDEKPVYVTGVTAGKTAKITLNSFGVFKTLSASNTISVIGVAADAPVFAEASAAVSAVRYVAFSEKFSLAAAPAGKVTFVKAMGALPAGLKVSYDAEANAMVLSGTPTAKPGDYVVVYQVKDGSVAGLTTEVKISIVTDPVDAVNYPGKANAALPKAVTLKNLPAYAKAEDGTARMAGLIQSLTIPPKGNASAKFLCSEGSFSLKASGWTAFDLETKQLSALLSSGKTGYSLNLEVENDGSVSAVLTMPGGAYGSCEAVGSTIGWSKTRQATDWQGAYSVALPVIATSVVEGREGIAPRGSGYLTLSKMASSALNTGTVKWAGVLPNGTAISGSTVLLEGETWAQLPVYISTKKDVCAIPMSILKNAHEVRAENSHAVLPAEVSVSGETLAAVASWSHKGSSDLAKVNYTADLDICGAIYEVADKLSDCCEYPQPKLTIDTASLVSVLGGTPVDLDPIDVVISGEAVTVDATQLTAIGGSAKFTRTSGLMSGSFKLPYLAADGKTKTVSATWKGVVLPNWGDCCEIGAPTRPFVNGTYYFTEAIKYEVTGSTGKVSTKTESVVRAGDASIADIVE